MTAQAQQTKNQRSLLVFFGLAYLFSWLVSVPLALQAPALLNPNWPQWLHYLGAFGPLLAASVACLLSGGLTSLRAFWRDAFRWPGNWRWWLLALSPLLVLALLAAVVALAGGQPLGWSQLGQLDFLPPLGWLALPLWIITFGLGEEMGWRAFAWPELKARWGTTVGTIILWLLWAGWHLPMFFYLYSASIVPGWLLGLLAGTIILTWLYDLNGSVLMVILWHGSFNFATGCLACKSGMAAAVVSSLVMVAAVIIVAYRALARRANKNKWKADHAQSHSA